LTRALMSEQFVSRRVIYASRNATKPIPEMAVLPDKFTSNLSSSSLCAAIAFMMLFCVQREGAAHLRDRLTLRLLGSQHTAATADYLTVFTGTPYFRGTVGIRPDHRDFIMRASQVRLLKSEAASFLAQSLNQVSCSVSESQGPRIHSVL
jgi:hypothetical protein